MKSLINKYSFSIRISLAIILALWLNVAHAALSGTYTIDPANPVSGTNYHTFKDAISDLVNMGTSAPVIFNVADGIYNESITLSSFNGGSAPNLVTFQSQSGDSSKVIIKPTGPINVINFYDTHVITFRKITIYQNSTGSNYAVNMDLSSYISFLSCQIVKTNTDGYLINDSRSLGSNNYTGNNLSGGSYALYLTGFNVSYHAGSIVNNKISDCLSGIYAYNFSGININANNIQLAGSSTLNTSYGIMFQYLQGSITINQNKIFVNAGQTALYFVACTDTEPGFATIANNMIIGYISFSNTDRFGFYFNNVVVNSTSSTQVSALQFFGSPNSTVTHFKIYNNNIVNMIGGSCIQYQSLYTNLYADYNNYYTTGSVIAVEDGANYSNILIWSIDNEIDSHSLSVYPGYYSMTDLHEKNYLLYHKGLYISSIPKDFDGDTRDQKTPDIGADEFSLTGYDLAVIDVLNLSPGMNCGDSGRPQVLISNDGYNDVINVPIKLTLNKNQSVLTDTIPFIKAGNSLLFTFKNPLNTIAGGNFQIKVFTMLPNDANKGDDTFAVSGFFTPGAYQPLTNDITLCHAPSTLTSYILRAKEKSSTDSLVWLDAYQNYLGTGDSLVRPFILNSTYFTIQAYSKFKYGGGLKDTAQGKGRFSTKPLPLIITPQINMTLDSVTVYPKNSGSFYIGGLKYNVTVTAPGAPVKIKLKKPYRLYKNQSSVIVIDTILTGGLYASNNGIPASPVSNPLVSVVQRPNDSLYRYLYDLKFTATSCPSRVAKINFNILSISLSLQKPADAGYQFKSGALNDPDIVCGKTISYNVVTGFDDSLYGSQWKISKVTVMDKDHITTFPSSFSVASDKTPALVNFALPMRSIITDYIIQVRVQNLATGCDTVYSRSFRFNVPQATILSTGSFCNDAVNFNAQTENSDSILWDFGDSTTSTLNNPFHQYVVPKNEKRFYWVKLKTVNTEGCINSDSEQIEIDNKPRAAFSYKMDSVSGTVFFTADDTTQGGYLWDFGDFGKGINAHPQHTYAKAGVFIVSLIEFSPAGCSDTISNAVLVIKKSGIIPDLSDHFQLSIFPNPAYHSISLQYQLIKTATVSVRIFDPQGKLQTVLQTPRKESAGKTTQNFYLTDNLANGMYLLKLNIDGEEVTKTILIAH